MKVQALCAVLGLSLLLAGCETTKVRPGQSVSFVEPANGAVVSSPFKVQFAVSGMEVKPAGEAGSNIGHHHVLIDRGSISEGSVIPHDQQHIHYGMGQTEAMVSLPPGNYRLTLQFADSFHKSYGSAMSQTINVTVK